MPPSSFARAAIVFAGLAVAHCLPALAQSGERNELTFGYQPSDRLLWTVLNCDQPLCEVPLRAFNRPGKNGDDCGISLADIIVIKPTVERVVWRLGNTGPSTIRFEFRPPVSTTPALEIVGDDSTGGSPNPVFEDEASSGPDPKLRAIKKIKRQAVGRLFEYNVHLAFLEDGKPDLQCKPYGPLIVNRG